MEKLNLNENFISRIYEDKSYWKDLKTTESKNVVIIECGTKNKDSGADFSNAKIRIDGFLFTGDVEIHKNFSDWDAHNHSKEKKYNKVILQIVFWEKENLKFPMPKVSGAREIPTVVLSKFLTKSIHTIWKEIINNPSVSFKLPCYPDNDKISSEQKFEFLKINGMKRINYRASRIKSRINELVDSGYNIKKKEIWEQVLFEFICEALGFSKNKEQFLKFSKSIPLKKLTTFDFKQIQIDSVLYGVSGFLHNVKFKDKYINEIREYWDEINRKLKLPVMEKAEWNFFRLRPQNFPTIRIAFASGLVKSFYDNDFAKKIINIFESNKNLNTRIKKLFSTVKVSEYWHSHYNFGKSKRLTDNILGSSRVLDIIVNVLLPFVYIYAETFSKSDLMKTVKDYYLHSKPASENEVTSIMQKQLNFLVLLHKVCFFQY